MMLSAFGAKADIIVTNDAFPTIPEVTIVTSWGSCAITHPLAMGCDL
jgi:hypothetical protein